MAKRSVTKWGSALKKRNTEHRHDLGVDAYRHDFAGVSVDHPLTDNVDKKAARRQ